VPRFAFVQLKIQPLVISKLRHFLILMKKIALALAMFLSPIAYYLIEITKKLSVLHNMG